MHATVRAAMIVWYALQAAATATAVAAAIWQALKRERQEHPWK
jgi:hypothetical protein